MDTRNKVFKKFLTLPKPIYYLETYNKKEKIIGGFYAHNLTPVNSDIFKIKKVIKQRRRGWKVKYFVKWKGYDSSHNSWIDQNDITNVYNGWLYYYRILKFKTQIHIITL